MRHPRRILGAATLTLAALLTSVAVLGSAAAAKGQPVVKAERPFDGFFYGDFDDGLILLAGSPIDAEFCADSGFPTVTKTYRQRRDGAWAERWRARQQVQLYDTELEAPVYIEQQCEAIQLDGAAPPVPFASGRAQVRSYFSPLASSAGGPPLPGARIVNRAFGFVTDDDGKRYRVQAQADLVLDENLEPVGSPEEFQSLRVRSVGPRP